MVKITGDLASRDGKEAADYVNKMVRWNDQGKDNFFDMDINQLRAKVSSTKNLPIIYVEHTWQQIKLSMAWYERQCNLVGYKEDVILREILLQRINGSELSPFRRSSIIYITTHKKSPIEKIDYSKNLCTFNIYEKLYRAYPYILSIDPAEGLSNDNNACTLINPYTLKPAMEFRSPYISQPDFFNILCRFLDEYCPKSMIIIEANKGRELINLFLSSHYRYQVYYDDNKMQKARVDYTDEYGALKRQSMERRAYGFDTTRRSRPELYAILEDVMDNQMDKICTEYLVEDVAGLIKKPPTGRVEAGPGAHDDNIMSYLFGLFVYNNAPIEILEIFGLRRGMVEPGHEVEVVETQEDQLMKLRELSGALPPELQAIINETLQQTDPVKNSYQYAREVQLAMAEDPFTQRELMKDPHRAHTVSADPHDDAFWAQYDSQILASNDEDEARYQVNIDDFI